MKLTKEEILYEPVGRKINEWVARYIMVETLEHPGFPYQEFSTEDASDGGEGFYCPRCGEREGTKEKCVKHYSSNIILAFEVLDEMHKLGHYIDVYRPTCDDDWRVGIGKTNFGKVIYHCGDFALMVCRAVLLAKLKEEE